MDGNDEMGKLSKTALLLFNFVGRGIDPSIICKLLKTFSPLALIILSRPSVALEKAITKSGNKVREDVRQDGITERPDRKIV